MVWLGGCGDLAVAVREREKGPRKGGTGQRKLITTALFRGPRVSSALASYLKGIMNRTEEAVVSI